jgi:hypothetical protein
MRTRAAGIEVLIKFTKSRVVTVLPTANQMNWSQMELSFASSPVTPSVGSQPSMLGGHLISFAHIKFKSAIRFWGIQPELVARIMISIQTTERPLFALLSFLIDPTWLAEVNAVVNPFEITGEGLLET